MQIVKQPQDLIREKYVIFLDGKNVTPKPLNPLSYEKGKERQISLLDIGSARSRSSSDAEYIYPSNMLFSELRQSSKKSVTARSNVESTTLYEAPERTSTIMESRCNVLPITKEEKMPEYVSVVLRETSTEYVFEMPSKTAIKDTDEGICFPLTITSTYTDLS